ncbi:centrosomal protein of 83 kDa-like [Hippoglossus stenolepis]|uniref:centrosomal protein of 83 kDa-like n=1 Tax=Hippoglossus stenolepis TaxID=195615 RepID=UPI001FAEC256|nr:centrosomal protein of 83 kDa-like [Hippoglossus stenolepis]
MTLFALGQLAPLGPLGKFELQKMLIHERMNYKNLMTDYQIQKAEHKSLQDRFTQLHGEQERLLSNRQTQKERVQLLLVQGELMDKTRELKELRPWVVTPQQLELLRTQVKQEMNAPVQEKFNKQEETEKYKSMYNKLQYKNTFIKSQFDHQSEEHSHMLEKRRSHYEVPLTCLEKDREHLVAQYQGSDPLCDGKGDEAQLREKSLLKFELKKLEKEVADLQAQKDNLDQQAENRQSVQIRQLSEYQAAVKLLEAERQSLRLQVERMESELHLSLEQNKQLTKQLHEAERESNSTCEVESLEKNSHKPEIASVKLECIPSKGDVERERHTMQGPMDDLQAGMEVLKAAMQQQRHILEKKREMVRRVEAAHGEEFCKTVTLHKEKLELDNPFTTLEQQRVQQDLADHAQKEELEEHLRSAQQGEESACREVQSLRTTLQQQSSKLEELEGQKAEIVELQQLRTLSYSEKDLIETNQELRETLDRVREELRKTRVQADDAEWLEEKHKLLQKYSHIREKLQRAAEAQKKRKTLTENKEKSLQDKIQLLQAQIEELELEVAAAKKRSSSGKEAKLNKQLKELQQRHNKFRQIILDSQAPFSGQTGLLEGVRVPALLAAAHTCQLPRTPLLGEERNIKPLEMRVSRLP